MPRRHRNAGQRHHDQAGIANPAKLLEDLQRRWEWEHATLSPCTSCGVPSKRPMCGPCFIASMGPANARVEHEANR